MALVLAACGVDVVGRSGAMGPETTFSQRLAYESDLAGLPEVALIDLPEFGRVVFPELEGWHVDEAAAWADSVGWQTVWIIDLESDEDVFYQMAGKSPRERLIVKHRSEVVVEAVAG